MRITSVLVFLVLPLLLFRWFDLASTGDIKDDAAQNFRMAYHFSQHGALSRDGLTITSSQDLKPTNYREPLPPVVLGLYFKGVQYLTGLPGEYFWTESGRRTAKLHNVLWAALLCFSVFLAVTRLTGVAVLGAAGALLAGWNAEIDSLYTELPAASLLVLSSFLGVLAFQTHRSSCYFICGLSAGALILIKGSFLYIIFALGICLALVFGRHIGQWGVKRVAVGLALFTVGVGVFVGPWLARNYYYFGTVSVTERSGVVLMIRAIKNQMTWTEYVGAFYAWAPWQCQEAVGRVLGFTSADLMKGGRLQHLNRSSDFAEDDRAAELAGEPGRIISYYRRARAERTRIETALREAGDPNPNSTGDIVLGQRAIRLILDHPVNHLLATAPFLWRGAPFAAPLLVIFVAICAMSRRRDIVIFVVPAMIMIAFFAVASHNIPRYNSPADPVVIIAAVATAQSLLVALYRRLGFVLPVARWRKPVWLRRWPT